MIWNDTKLREYCESHSLVTPYDSECVNPASIDLRLGNLIRIPNTVWQGSLIRQMKPAALTQMIADNPYWSDPIEFDSHWLLPGDFVLCHSLELVQLPSTAAAILVLKSSMGRKGLNHSHSGWGDPTFGLASESNPTGGASWTFELYNIAPWPVELKASQRVIQMVMMDLVAPPEVDYRSVGHYVYQTGPTPARESLASKVNDSEVTP